MTVIVFIIILTLLILVHELGHFFVAKRAGIRVDEFGLGFPPSILKVRRGETTYSLNLIPFGGFVKIFGEDALDVKPDDPDIERSFGRKSRLTQALVLASGVAANLILAWILISVGFMTGLPSSVSSRYAGDVKKPELVIVNVITDSPAAEAQLRPGDRILALRSNEEALISPSAPSVQEFIARHGGKEIFLRLRRGADESEVVLIPKEGIAGGRPAIGIGMDMIGTLRLPPHRAVAEAMRLTFLLTAEVAEAIYNFFVQAFRGKANLSDVTGPVGIFGLVGDARELGFIYLLSFTAFISINLAVINFIPFPALDGGRLLFLAIEAVISRPIPVRISKALNILGFVALILLMLVITYRDIVKLF